MKALAAALAGTGAVLAARVWAGPFDRPFGVHSPMNLEGIFALLFLALLFLQSKYVTLPAREGGHQLFLPALLLPALLVAITALAFCRYLAFPLLADDYVHIGYARDFSWHSFVGLFTVPARDHFFRPLGYLSYALDALWAGLSPTAWRTGNLLIHLANTILVFALCRKLEIGRAPAFFGALLFGIHASRPEAVTWVAARFDLVAVLFGLLCLVCLLHGWRSFALAAMLLAAMSKESAYVIPLLAVAILWYARRPWKEAVPLFFPACLVFAYRWYLLGGIGGYQSAGDGVPTVLKFRLASTLKALLPRFWGTLLFPVNWTDAPGLFFACAFTAAIAALGYVAWKGADRRKLALGFFFATICSLPVHQFLSIGPDLEKARVLYFASIGLAIMCAAMTSHRIMWVPAAALLLFQFGALQHNLEIWKRTGFLAQATCRAGAEHSSGPLLVIGLPNVVDGVYFLHTGFPDCVEQLSGKRPESKLLDDGSRTDEQRQVFVWNPKSRKLEQR